jgi:hypothetical protein
MSCGREQSEINTEKQSELGNKAKDFMGGERKCVGHFFQSTSVSFSGTGEPREGNGEGRKKEREAEEGGEMATLKGLFPVSLPSSSADTINYAVVISGFLLQISSCQFLAPFSLHTFRFSEAP